MILILNKISYNLNSQKSKKWQKSKKKEGDRGNLGNQFPDTLSETSTFSPAVNRVKGTEVKEY